LKNKLDILAVGVHPDDIELGCCGTLLSHIKKGKKCGILDLTKGELGSRGTPELRELEAKKASELLGINTRVALDLEDGCFENNHASRLKVIEVIRKYQPEIVLANAINDRHPDHGRAAKLVADACFYSGLAKIETLENGVKQAPWRPKAVYHYIQDYTLKPDFVVDVSDFAEKKREAIMCFSSQFYNPDSKEPQTPISSPEFLESVFSKMSIFGRTIGVRYAEGFTVNRYIGVNNLFDLI
jgi:bacillithiol biosynthesis deacetylase BshB1